MLHQSNSSESFETEKKELLKWLKRRLKAAIKLKNNLEQQHAKCSAWNEKQHEALLLQSNFYRLKKGMAEITVTDWDNQNRERKIQLDPTLLPLDEVEKRFKLSKRLKRGLEAIQKPMQEAEKTVTKWNAFLEQCEVVNELSALNELQNITGYVRAQAVLEKKSEEPPEPFHRFYSARGLAILVGKNAKGNEKLTFHYAKGSDWWLHVSHYPGSHVVVQVNKNEEPDEETLADAMQLALFYSKAKDAGEGEICLTQKKFVARLGKGKTGKVQISHHKLVYTKLNLDRLNRIRKPQP